MWPGMDTGLSLCFAGLPKLTHILRARVALYHEHTSALSALKGAHFGPEEGRYIYFGTLALFQELFRTGIGGSMAILRPRPGVLFVRADPAPCATGSSPFISTRFTAAWALLAIWLVRQKPALSDSAFLQSRWAQGSC